MGFCCGTSGMLGRGQDLLIRCCRQAAGWTGVIFASSACCLCLQSCGSEHSRGRDQATEAAFTADEPVDLLQLQIPARSSVKAFVAYGAEFGMPKRENLERYRGKRLVYPPRVLSDVEADRFYQSLVDAVASKVALKRVSDGRNAREFLYPGVGHGTVSLICEAESEGVFYITVYMSLVLGDGGGVHDSRDGGTWEVVGWRPKAHQLNRDAESLFMDPVWINDDGTLVD